MKGLLIALGKPKMGQRDEPMHHGGDRDGGEYDDEGEEYEDGEEEGEDEKQEEEDKRDACKAILEAIKNEDEEALCDGLELFHAACKY